MKEQQTDKFTIITKITASLKKQFLIQRKYFPNLKEQARKGFRTPSAMQGIGQFQNFRNFLRNFLRIFSDFGGIFAFRRIFGRNSFGGTFWEKCFGRIFLGGFFWEDFLGGFFWEDFFGRIFLGGITQQKLMFLSRFWSKARRRTRNLDPQKCEASSSHLKIDGITFHHHFYVKNVN